MDPENENVKERYFRRESMDMLNQKISECSIFDETREAEIPVLTKKEIHFGRVLGRGGYCTVSALKHVSLMENDEESLAGSIESTYTTVRKRNRRGSLSSVTSMLAAEREFYFRHDREHISRHFIRHKDGKHRYAIKTLSSALFAKGGVAKQRFKNGVIDLAMEVKFLSVVQHPHIIKMRAMSNVGYCEKDFFILLDRLDMTLNGKVVIWKKELPSIFAMGKKSKEKRDDHFCHRLVVGYDLCSALVYLHEKQIVHRDLKPMNIGFDIRDEVKIFDFGLSTELTKTRQIPETDAYKLTARLGSTRYMAPEVYHGMPYNEKSDVYSYGMILLQCLDLETPFASYLEDEFIDKVFKKNRRPKIRFKNHDTLKSLIQGCWLRDFSQRYSCSQIIEILKEEISKLDDSVQLDISNHTAASMQQNINNGSYAN